MQLDQSRFKRQMTKPAKTDCNNLLSYVDLQSFCEWCGTESRVFACSRCKMGIRHDGLKKISKFCGHCGENTPDTAQLETVPLPKAIISLQTKLDAKVAAYQDDDLVLDQSVMGRSTSLKPSPDPVSIQTELLPVPRPAATANLPSPPLFDSQSSSITFIDQQVAPEAHSPAVKTLKKRKPLRISVSGKKSKFNLNKRESSVSSDNIPVRGANMYGCPHCDQAFTRKDTVIQHAENAHYPGIYQCPHCSIKQSTYKNLCSHSRKSHAGMPSLKKEEIVNEAHPDPSLVVTFQMIRIVQDKQKLAPSTSTTTDGLDRSKAVHQTKGDAAEAGAAAQMKESDRDDVEAPRNQSPTSVNKMEDRVLEARLENDDKPDQESDFRDSPMVEGNLVNRFRKVPAHGVKRYRCPHCSAVYPSKDSVIRHAELKHYPGRYSCPHCSFNSTNKATVKNHADRFHSLIITRDELINEQPPDPNIIVTSDRIKAIDEQLSHVNKEEGENDEELLTEKECKDTVLKQPNKPRSSHTKFKPVQSREVLRAEPYVSETDDDDDRTRDLILKKNKRKLFTGRVTLDKVENSVEPDSQRTMSSIRIKLVADSNLDSDQSEVRSDEVDNLIDPDPEMVVNATKLKPVSESNTEIDQETLWSDDEQPQLASPHSKAKDSAIHNKPGDNGIHNKDDEDADDLAKDQAEMELDQTKSRQSRAGSSKRYKCPHCSHIATRKYEIIEHAEEIHYPGLYHCPLCVMIFHTKCRLIRHTHGVHKGEEVNAAEVVNLVEPDPAMVVDISQVQPISDSSIHDSKKFNLRVASPKPDDIAIPSTKQDEGTLMWASSDSNFFISVKDSDEIIVTSTGSPLKSAKSPSKARSPSLTASPLKTKSPSTANSPLKTESLETKSSLVTIFSLKAKTTPKSPPRSTSPASPNDLPASVNTTPTIASVKPAASPLLKLVAKSPKSPRSENLLSGNQLSDSVSKMSVKKAENDSLSKHTDVSAQRKPSNQVGQNLTALIKSFTHNGDEEDEDRLDRNSAYGDESNSAVPCDELNETSCLQKTDDIEPNISIEKGEQAEETVNIENVSKKTKSKKKKTKKVNAASAKEESLLGLHSPGFVDKSTPMKPSTTPNDLQYLLDKPVKAASKMKRKKRKALVQNEELQSKKPKKLTGNRDKQKLENAREPLSDIGLQKRKSIGDYSSGIADRSYIAVAAEESQVGDAKLKDGTPVFVRDASPKPDEITTPSTEQDKRTQMRASSDSNSSISLKDSEEIIVMPTGSPLKSVQSSSKDRSSSATASPLETKSRSAAIFPLEARSLNSKYSLGTKCSSKAKTTPTSPLRSTLPASLNDSPGSPHDPPASVNATPTIASVKPAASPLLKSAAKLPKSQESENLSSGNQPSDSVSKISVKKTENDSLSKHTGMSAQWKPSKQVGQNLTALCKGFTYYGDEEDEARLDSSSAYGDELNSAVLRDETNEKSNMLKTNDIDPNNGIEKGEEAEDTVNIKNFNKKTKSKKKNTKKVNAASAKEESSLGLHSPGFVDKSTPMKLSTSIANDLQYFQDKPVKAAGEVKERKRKASVQNEELQSKKPKNLTGNRGKQKLKNARQPLSEIGLQEKKLVKCDYSSGMADQTTTVVPVEESQVGDVKLEDETSVFDVTNRTAFEDATSQSFASNVSEISFCCQLCPNYYTSHKKLASHLRKRHPDYIP